MSLINRLSEKRSIDDLSDAEILALAISSEEDDARIYRAYADKLRQKAPKLCAQFEAMAAEEDHHRQCLIDQYKSRFGNDIPLLRREQVRGFPVMKTDWLLAELDLDRVRKNVEKMEKTAERYYLAAAKRTKDADTRKLFGDLAAEEAKHTHLATTGLEKESIDAEIEEAERDFILTYIQPGLAGLIDGSVSTLAPIFAAAYATQSSHETLLIGLSASVGAGISMGFTEAISDDGVISGRGSPIARGIVTGLMTTIGGLGHALPYLIADVWLATVVAAIVVLVELVVITYVQHKYMRTPWMKAGLQVIIGGGLVLAAGILIGSA